jgi:proline iminopeptidase
MRGTCCRRVWFVCLLAFVAGLPASAQDGKVSRDGFELHYRTVGTGTPMVILAGGPGLEVDYIVPMADHLPASYQKVFLEQRGTGRSTLPEVKADALTLKLVVEDLEALRVHLKQERLLLVGHSWGGVLAMRYAAAYPDRVDRLVIIGSPGPSPRFREWFRDNIVARMRTEDVEAMQHWAAAAERGMDADKAMLEALKAMVPGYVFDRAKGLTMAAQLPDGMFNVQVNMLMEANGVMGDDFTGELKSLRRPVLIVHGHQDPIGQFCAEEIHRAIAGSQLRYIAKCGHFPWIEQPEEFQRIVAEFMSSDDRKH